MLQVPARFRLSGRNDEKAVSPIGRGPLEKHILSSLYKYQMLGSVIGLQAALQHSPYAFVVCSCEAAFFRLTHASLRRIP